MKLKNTLLLFLIIPLLSFSVHKYYLSLTQINYKPEAKAIQITINVFMDDIETALNKDNNIDLQLTTKKELKNNDIYFENYLKDKLFFKVDNISKNFNYIGKEYDGDLVFFYLEIENIEKVTTIDVTNKILIEHFDEQQNLIKSKVNGKSKSKLLTKEENSVQLKY
ncbi:hypothetical protein BW723_15740 [Polaribacter reichenbachii]|uniref:Peptidase E n=1 Tax=Polaribacter reichenbachii TaxID=996801 RepID=A0A1B8U571_9FLAO|nr:DUF6702 family protein [Polaribacter reichenbachii]APZ47652.1 hypothetical protein BW723_15740 [Polaribacter reichenbachii]AUC18292.1 hypothetical protein BTO17_06185 [Polaribacter reichenbachii]OBY66995.1 hypothetical protein LPB301_04045 [Polaribacter reichenbachii]